MITTTIVVIAMVLVTVVMTMVMMVVVVMLTIDVYDDTWKLQLTTPPLFGMPQHQGT